MNPALFVSALSAEVTANTPLAEKLRLSPSQLWNVLVVARLRDVLRGLAQLRGRDVSLLASGRLFQCVPGFEADSLGSLRQALLSAVQPVPAIRSSTASQVVTF